MKFNRNNSLSLRRGCPRPRNWSTPDAEKLDNDTLNFTVLRSFDSSSNKTVRILALLEFLATPRTVPFHCARRKLNKVYALHVKPLPGLTLHTSQS